MGTGLFYWILNMSIAGGIVGCVLLAIRIIRKIPRRAIVPLWGIVLLRLLVPVGIGGKYGLFPLLESVLIRPVPASSETSLLPVRLTMMNSVRLADSYSPLVFRSAAVLTVLRIASRIWLTVALALILCFSILYFTTLRGLKDAEEQDGVFFSDRITSPAVYGILRPRILLPAGMRGKENEFVLLHEKTHIRRFDNLLRVIAFFTAAVHWFNPLSWIFLRRFLTDLELACDESVLSRCGEEKKKEYALSLLDSVPAKDGGSKALFSSAFGGAGIRIRLEHILSYRKMTAAALCVTVLLVLALTYALLTNAV